MTDKCKMVVFSDKAYNAVIRETFEWEPVETGGILLGHILDNGCWIVMEVLPPGYSEGREGDNVHHEMGYFEYNQRFVNYLANSVATQYKIPLELIGLWHRHPGSMDFFSSTDDGTNKAFASQNPNGAISGLVNVDPKLRMTMYYIRHNDNGVGRPNYLTVDVEVGSDLIPEEYFEMQYYSGENSDLHPLAPRRNSQREGEARRSVRTEESTVIHYQHQVSDWLQQAKHVFNKLNKKKYIGWLFSILIIVVCFILIKQSWNGMKGKSLAENAISTTDEFEKGAKHDTIAIEIDNEKLPKACDMQVAQTHKLQMKCSDEEFNISLLRWRSSNEDVARVDENGIVTAKSKGIADIGLYFGNKIVDSIKITVK